MLSAELVISYHCAVQNGFELVINFQTNE